MSDKLSLYTKPTPASVKGLLYDLLIRQEQIDSALRGIINNLGPKDRHKHSNTMFLINMNTTCIKNLIDLLGIPRPTKPKPLEAPDIVVHSVKANNKLFIDIEHN